MYVLFAPHFFTYYLCLLFLLLYYFSVIWRLRLIISNYAKQQIDDFVKIRLEDRDLFEWNRAVGP